MPNPDTLSEALALIRPVAERAAEGEWKAMPFLYDYGTDGPDWFIAGGEPIQGNLGGDFDEADATLAALSVNLVRDLLAGRIVIDSPASQARPTSDLTQKEPRR